MVIVDDILEDNSDLIPPYASPNPSPARGVYGFALFIVSWCSFALYLIWALLPTPYLKLLHLTYLPAKYWAIAIPLLLPITVAAFIILVLAHNLIQLHGIFDDVEVGFICFFENEINYFMKILNLIIDDDFGGSARVGNVDLQSFFANTRRKCSVAAIMLCETFRILKAFPSSLLSARQRTHLLGRRLRRKAKIPANIPANALSVSKINELIRKRLETSWYENQASTSEMDLASLSADRYLEINASKYTSLIASRQAMKMADNSEKKNLTAEHGYEEIGKGHDNLLLAGSFLLKANSTVSKNFAENPSTFSKVPDSDRGFYIYGDSFVDEFVVGSATDIPGGELENIDHEVLVRYGAEDAVEEIDFQLPGQSSNPKDNVVEDESDEFLENYGTVDPTVPSSNKPCGACGAKFHCRDASLPGFVPAEIFLKLEDYNHQLCRRCYMLKRHNFLLNVNVCEVDYHSMMKHLKLKQEALIILVVDMCDLPGSIYSELPKIIGYQKPMIVVGNKVDLLPPDAHSGFLRHFRQVLHGLLKETGFVDNFNILHMSLISAKTGYGVEDLITVRVLMNFFIFNFYKGFCLRKSSILSEID
uniref:PIG-P domain-containing protein n=1 Tax=Wuchereria bancrofti TaxID=6293 RepID=A0A1I8EMI0_WUCBA